MTLFAEIHGSHGVDLAGVQHLPDIAALVDGMGTFTGGTVDHAGNHIVHGVSIAAGRPAAGVGFFPLDLEMGLLYQLYQRMCSIGVEAVGRGDVRTVVVTIETHQIQLKAVSLDSMLEAQVNPDAHKQLIVRVWGWSGYFVELDRTAFFPEGGGQGADVGKLCGFAVGDFVDKDPFLINGFRAVEDGDPFADFFQCFSGRC